MPLPRIATRLFTLATALLSRTIIVTNKSVPVFSDAQLLPNDPEHEDFYCGWDWEEANQDCEYPCPSGLDDECPPLSNGRPRRCIAAAGCFARFKKVYWTGVISLSFDRAAHLSNSAVASVEMDAESGSFITNANLMEDEEMEAFESSFAKYLFGAFEEEIEIDSVRVQEQQYDRPCVAAAYGGIDPTSTSLDMMVRVVGEFIPIGDKDFTDDEFGDEVLKLINYFDPESFVEAIKNEHVYFGATIGISAIEADNVVETPSASPSEPPSRSFDQIFDIRIDPRPSASYGIVFSVRTKRCDEEAAIQQICGTILINAMSFVTLHEGNLEYMVYSRLGPYERFLGRDNSWDLIASGQTIGKGAKEYTRMLEGDTVIDYDSNTRMEYVGFKPVHVPGDRGMRSFYVTLTKRFTQESGDPVPILFSYPIQMDSEGERKYEVVASTNELEVYEGDAVLDYPWHTNRDGPFYRRPRGFIGSFEYERYPCLPLRNFTGWPCPYRVQTQSPTTRPTGKPTNSPVTGFPTKKPTLAPTVKPPVVQANQTDSNVTELVSDSGNETNGLSFNASLTDDEILPEQTNNGFILSWENACKSYGLGLAIFEVLMLLH